MKYLILFLFLITLSGAAVAQDSTAWSLERCLLYAYENNIDLKRQQLNVDYKGVQINEKKYSMLPNLNASVGYNVGFGRVPDQSSFTYVNSTTQTGDLSASSSTSIFEGFTKQNTLKKSRVDYQAAQSDFNKAKNDISLQLANQYLQILYGKEMVAVAKEQYSQTSQTVETMEKRVKAGSKPMSSLLDVKSQLAKEALAVVQAENDLNYALLNMVLMLDLDSLKGFDVVVPNLPELVPGLLDSPRDIYDVALQNMPEIKSSQLAVESSQYDLSIAKGGVYPSLLFNAGWGSRIAYYTGKDNFSDRDEFRNNSNSYLGVSLNIPVFNGHRVTTSIKSAKLGLVDAEYQLVNKKLTLRKEIAQASNDAISAYKKYLAGKEAVESYKEAFKYTQKRFEVEAVSAVDYNLAKTNLLKAESELLQAKYEYIFKTKILDFYKGVPITL